MHPTDLPQIVRADAMFTPDGPIENAELEIDADGRIVYAGPARAGRTATHEFTGQVLMPGLVNGHTHSAMTLLRGASDDDGFMPWLAAVQATEKYLTRDDVAAGLQLAMLEMIESGTTTFADMYHWDAGLLELVRAAGMRVLAAPAYFTDAAVGFPGVSSWTGAEVLDATESLAARFEDDAQIALAYGPHAPYTTPSDELRALGERARRTGLPIHIHIAESRAEVDSLLAETGRTPADHLHALGVTGASVLAAHCVHVTAEEIAMFARTGTAVSHNPVSNLKLGCGVAPLPELLAAGVPVALGTDSAASNNSLDLFEEIKIATILHRGVRQDAAAVRATDALDLATRGGARALGFADVGELVPGARADVIALDVTRAGAIPHASLASHLAFAARGSDVQHVFIGGRHVYAAGKHLTLDAPEIRRRAAAAAARLRRAVNGNGSPVSPV